MKNIWMLLLLALTFIGCDAPQRTRLQSAVGTNSYSNFTTGTTTSGTTTPATTGTTTGTTTDEVTSVAGFSACDITPKYFAAAFGYMGVCQSTSDETIFKVKSSVTIQSPSDQVCLIPTYKDTTGASVYIGQPQCTYTTANSIITGKLYKNRTGFESYAITGLMILQKAYLTEYLTCMNAYINYATATCPYGYATNTNCAALANTYRNNVCTTFKTARASSYVDIRLK